MRPRASGLHVIGSQAELQRLRNEIAALRDCWAMAMPDDGVLVVRVPGNAEPEQATAIGEALQEALLARGKRAVDILLLNDDVTLEAVSDEAMGAAGWVRATPDANDPKSPKCEGYGDSG